MMGVDVPLVFSVYFLELVDAIHSALADQDPINNPISNMLSVNHAEEIISWPPEAQRGVGHATVVIAIDGGVGVYDEREGFIARNWASWKTSSMAPRTLGSICLSLATPLTLARVPITRRRSHLPCISRGRLRLLRARAPLHLCISGAHGMERVGVTLLGHCLIISPIPT